VKTLASLIPARLMLASLALLASASAQAGPATQADPSLPAYAPVQGVSGSIKSVGSDTMNNEMTLWAEAFKAFYPDVKISIEAKGSGTAPPALIAGTANFGPMSREMKAKEVDDFTKEFGYAPTAVPSSIDMLAVYVNKDNPIKGLSFQQVDAIFSKTRKGGSGKEVRTWGELGLTGEWADKPISIYGRNSASGTYGYFKEHALFNGDFKDEVKEQAGSSSVVQAVGSDRYAIGYSGFGYRTADVRAVPLAAESGKPFVEATAANGYAGEYPLARFLWIYVNKKPDAPLDPLRREFLRFVLSKQGQQEVVKDGYLPLPGPTVEKTLEKLGLAAAAAPKS
jgi:phosphate transport system substrate-binding protein